MPIYEYRCERGHTFEVMQRMTDDPLTVCDEHGTPVQRVFHPVAVHFKGSGFYNTDYGKKKSGAAAVLRGLVIRGLVLGQLVEVGLVEVGLLRLRVEDEGLELDEELVGLGLARPPAGPAPTAALKDDRPG